MTVLRLQADEVQLLRDSLRSLRNNFRDHDPQQHTLDTLEQGIVSLMDRLRVLHTHRVLTHARQRHNCGQITVVTEPTRGKNDLNSVIDLAPDERLHCHRRWLWLRNSS